MFRISPMVWIHPCLFLLAVAFLVILGGCEPQESSEQAADFVFTNGIVYTVDDNNPEAQAVAVRGDEIVYVGADAGAQAFVGEGTELIDLDGKMLMPGFVDSHIHSMAGGFIARGQDLQTDDKEELLQLVRDYAATVPPDEPVIAYGWRLHLFPDPGPRKEWLDEIDSERPIYLWGIDGHAAWANSKAFEVAGVDKDHPDTQPPFSYYQRDEDGSPSGWIVEVPAQLEVLGELIEMGPAYIEGGLREWFPRFAAAGLTTVFDAGIQGMSISDGYALYQKFEQEGVLPFRVFGSYYWNNPDEDPLPALRELIATYQSDLVKVRKLKVNADGGDDKHNAYYVEPYSDREDGWIGETLLPAETINQVIAEADAEGIDFFCHCWGDGAARVLLDAAEAAMAANADRDRRHTISHAAYIHPDDVARFAELRIIADMQVSWAGRDPLMVGLSTQRLGEDRVNRYMPAREILDSDGKVSISSDWPVAGYAPTYQPLETIQVAVTRQLLVEPYGEPLGGEAARMSVAEAIKAHTLTGAYGIGADDEVGSLVVGKKADLIVLETSLFEVDVYDIGDVDIQFTMMNGNVTHREGL